MQDEDATAVADVTSMLRVPKRRLYQLPPLGIYREDVEDLEAMFRSFFDDVDLQFGDFALRTGADLAKVIGRTSGDLVVRGDKDRWPRA